MGERINTREVIPQVKEKVWENKSPLVQFFTQCEILFPIFYFFIYHSIKRDKTFPKIADRFRNNFHGGRFKVNQT